LHNSPQQTLPLQPGSKLAWQRCPPRE
jgi:hypothetical protein